MLAWTIRINNDFIRTILLLLIFPFYYAKFVIKAWMPVKYGGHPNRKRLQEKEFYLFPVGIFFPALFGYFVKE